MKYIIDTHSLVWYFANDKRLSKRVEKIIQKAECGKDEIIIPVIVLLECIDISEKKKIQFKMKDLFDFIERMDNFRIIDLDFDITKKLAQIGKGLDLHDRVILTVSKIYQGTILTRDSEIKNCAKTIW